MAWKKNLSPRRFVEAGVRDVEAFLRDRFEQVDAAWTKRKQALHDLMADAYVIR